MSVVLDQAVPAIRFARRPDLSAVTEEVLEAAVGTYRMGLISLVVARSATSLSVQVEGAPARRLAPAGGLRFSADGLVVELLPPDRIQTPYGEFVRATSA